MSPIHIHFVTLVTGATRVGTDTLGNKYFRAKARKGYNHERRWVIYKGEAEASNVPPEWHGWLHHQTDAVPQASSGYRRIWQKPHRPNLTGTNQAYRPPGHVLMGGQRDKATGDYEAWKPE
jgi:NADH:ubiquinone oxidoreductase subunit